MRREGVRATLRSAAVVTTLGVLYFRLPMNQRPDISATRWIVGGLLVLAWILYRQVRAIVASPYPRLRGLEALATSLSLFVLLFATCHYLLELGRPGSYTQAMTRLDALYFTVTVLCTVGLGDIAPVSQQARIVTTVQMASDLVWAGVVARVLLSAVQVGIRRRR